MIDTRKLAGETADQLRVGITEDYVILKKVDYDIPQKLHDAIRRPETGAAYCESPTEAFPIIQPQLQARFEPSVIALKTELFNGENVDLTSFFNTIIKVYHKAIVRRI